ncbi:hypothetical protein T484DRAFT_2697332 [Baffinella frigidus]|nr:hypothetical protein T484DRAFT_2697332 [Cryptophyta sp. CCMP2293]
MNVLLGIAFAAFMTVVFLEDSYGDLNPELLEAYYISGILNAACCFLVAAVVRCLRPTLLRHETVVSAVLQTIAMCLYLTIPVFADLRKMNHTYCPTLLVSVTYTDGIPRRHCVNTDTVETSRCVVESFDITGIACTSSTMDGLALYGTAVYAFIPVFKQMSPRAALMVVVVYVVAIPVSGFSVDADAPLIVFHTLFAATIGLSVAWLRSKGLQLSKWRFMVTKNLEQRAERNRRLLGALIPRSVSPPVPRLGGGAEGTSSGLSDLEFPAEAFPGWRLSHLSRRGGEGGWRGTSS